MTLLDLFSEVKRQPAECVVELDNGEITDLYPALVEVVVETNRKQWTTATLVLETRRLEDGTWTVQDDGRIKPWVPVKVSAVFGDETEEVMRGYIREVKAEYPAEKGSARVTVVCQDDSLKMDRLHVEQPWPEDGTITDGQIATQIIQRHNLQLDGTPGEGQTVQELNQNTTDIRFLKKRADANGYEIIFREGKVYFGDMRLEAYSIQPTILVYAGNDTNCISFNIQDDGHKPDRAAYQVAAEVGPNNPPVEVTPNLRELGTEPLGGASGLDDFTWRPQRQGVNDDTQMEAVAQQAVNEANMKIKVDGELDGSLYGHVLRTGELVGVDGLGERYSGTYYVDSASHRFDVNGYRVSFKLLRNAYGDDLAESSSSLAGVI